MFHFACLLAIITPGAAPWSSPRSVEQTSPPITVRIPTERPTGNPIVDRIRFTYYPPSQTPAPAVVIVHSLAEGRRGFLHRQHHRMAAHFARRGIASAVMELPYHMSRLPRGVSNLRLFTATSLKTAAAFDQGASDISTVASWLRNRPEVERSRIGVVGLSLGAILTHLAMGRDSGLSAGVAMLGGADLEAMRRGSFLARLFHPNVRTMTADEREALNNVDPLTYAGENHPRRVLMIQASRDTLVPPSGAVKLWRALGKPPIRWVDANHFGLALAGASAAKAAEEYLRQVWAGVHPGKERLPPIIAPTIKIGLISGLDAAVTPGVQWQAVPIGMRADHMALFHLDVGLSYRGPFGALSLTVNPSLDVGIGRRFQGRAYKPFVSLHLVF